MVAGCVKSCNCRGKESSGLLWGLSILEALIQYFWIYYTEVAAIRNVITIERVRVEKKAAPQTATFSDALPASCEERLHP